MKNRNLRTIAAILLVFSMLFSSLTLASAESTVTPDSTTDVFVPTTSASDEGETTTGSYDDGYDDGWDDGYDLGWDHGYGSGWNDGYNQGQENSKDIFTIIRERIYEIRYNIKEFFKNLENKIKEAFGISDIDKNYLPSADTTNLEDDEDAALICYEFNAKAEALLSPSEPINYIKTEKVGIEIVDCPGGKVTAALVNPIVENFLVDETEEYKYEMYYTSGMQSVYLMPSGITSAKKTENADGTTDYEFVLIDETTFFDGEDEYLLDQNGEFKYDYFYNDYVADALYLSYLDLDPVKVKKATVYYPGTTIRAKTDAEGRITKLDILMPVEGSGTASVYLTSLDVEVKGYRNEGFEISYPGYNIDIDMDSIPDGSQETLAGNEDAAALCDEFEALISAVAYEVPDNATLKYENTIEAYVTDCPGGSTVAAIVNPIIQNFTGTTAYEVTVDKGDGAPYIYSIGLSPEGLTVAEKTVNDDGTTDYKFVLKKEAEYFDGSRTYAVQLVDGKIQMCDLYHQDIYRQIHLEYVDLGPITVNNAEIYYDGATITAKTDANGRLVNYTLNHPVSGTATGKMAYITATVSVAGVETENIDIIYS